MGGTIMDWNWLKEGFEEPTGGLSWGRIASSAAMVAVIAWIAHFLYINRTFPSSDTIKSLTEFMLAPYGSNKLITAVQAFSRNPVGNDPNNPQPQQPLVVVQQPQQPPPPQQSPQVTFVGR
jgi:hypothetical protein